MALPMDDKTIPDIDYLNPELLSKDTLISILNQKQMCPIDIEGMDKQKLIDFFYKHIIPLPQRLNCKSRRWQRLYDRYLRKETQKRTLESIESESNGNRRKSRKTTNSTSNVDERFNETKEKVKRIDFSIEKPTSSLNCKVRKLNLSENEQSKMNEGMKDMKRKHQKITWP